MDKQFINKNFSERLNDLMIEKNVTVKTLATALGVSLNNVYGWKSGKYSISLSQILKLADYFDCSLEYLVGNTDKILDFTPKKCSDFYGNLETILKNQGILKKDIHLNTLIKYFHLHKWKRGSDPYINSLIILSNYLGVTLDFLVGRE